MGGGEGAQGSAAWDCGSGGARRDSGVQGREVEAEVGARRGAAS